MRPAIIEALKTSLQVWDEKLRLKQSLQKAQDLKKGWAMDSSVFLRIAHCNHSINYSKYRIEEACDSISIVEVFHSIEKGAVTWD